MTPKEVAYPHLERAGITTQQIDDDLKAVRDTTIWLARQVANGVRSLATNGATRVSANFRRWTARE
jgi:hypothetical protein